MGENDRIAVIGAGVVGLTTATLLQDALPSAHVTIIAEKFFTETTSDGAAGIFRPSNNFRGPSLEITRKWLRDSYTFYDSLLRSKSSQDASDAGLTRMKLYMVATESSASTRNDFMEEIMPNFEILSPEELCRLYDNKYKFGSVCTTFIVECRKYLPYLMDRFKSRGGRVTERKLENLQELSKDYDLVFNCSGLGSRELAGDSRVIPIRGQVFKVNAPWVKDALYVDTDTYIIPSTTGIVTLGGTRQFDSTNEKLDKHDAAAIWERCTQAIPSLKRAQIAREWVGLRPYRSEVRVEKEWLTFSNGEALEVIHNYGHGGYGVLSAPGTSMNAVSLGIQALNENKSKL